MTEAKTIALKYSTIINAKQTFDRVLPVLEQLLKFRDEGIRFSPAMVGEAIMGDDYHATIERRTYGGVRKVRLPKAYSLSSTIGHALYILRKTGMVTYTTEKDMEHPHIFEDEDYGYVLNGTPIPELMKIKINGCEVTIKARDIIGVESKWMKRQVTRYPKIDWYTFKK